MRVSSLAAISALALFATGTAPAASFPCEKAATAVEKSICADQFVSELDEHLGRYYSAARAALGAGKTCLAQDQKNWLKTRNACKDANCLKRVYLARLAALDALQPGMTAVKNIELPRVDTLMWIIPAAEDTEAAPPPPASAPPFAVKGEIVSDIETGDGFVIRDATGRKHPILLLMFMEKASSVALESLIRSSAVYEARGRAEKSEDGSTHFSPGACTFVYRLAK
jgi:uncharacterized protein